MLLSIISGLGVIIVGEIFLSIFISQALEKDANNLVSENRGINKIKEELNGDFDVVVTEDGDEVGYNIPFVGKFVQLALFENSAFFNREKNQIIINGKKEESEKFMQLVDLEVQQAKAYRKTGYTTYVVDILNDQALHIKFLGLGVAVIGHMLRMSFFTFVGLMTFWSPTFANMYAKIKTQILDYMFESDGFNKFNFSILGKMFLRVFAQHYLFLNFLGGNIIVKAAIIGVLVLQHKDLVGKDTTGLKESFNNLINTVKKSIEER